MTTAHRTDQQQILYDYITARPNAFLTIADVAYALGRSPGKRFTMDLAAVRHWAAGAGDVITNCDWNPFLNKWTFSYLPRGMENGQANGPLRQQQKQAGTRVRNIGEQAAYSVRNAKHKQHRAIARFLVEWARNSENYLVAIEELQQALDERE